MIRSSVLERLARILNRRPRGLIQAYSRNISDGCEPDLVEEQALSGFDPALLVVREPAPGKLGRRDWLRGFAIFFGALLFSPMRLRESPTSLEFWLQNHSVGENRALKRLGAAYLVAHPEERDRSLLSQLLTGDQTRHVRLRLIENIARDWAEHNICIVEGWVLARSESRLCAALHLMDGLQI